MRGTTIIASPGVALLKIEGQRRDEIASWGTLGTWLDPAPNVQRATALVLINDSKVAMDIPVPSGAWMLSTGSTASKVVKVEPFRSAVLLAARDGTGLPPYVLASELQRNDSKGTKPVKPFKPPKPTKNSP